MTKYEDVWLLDDEKELVESLAGFLSTNSNLRCRTFLTPEDLQAALEEAHSNQTCPPVITLDVSYESDISSHLFASESLLVLLRLAPSKKIILTGHLKDEYQDFFILQDEDTVAGLASKSTKLPVYDVVLKSLGPKLISEKISRACRRYEKEKIQRDVGLIAGSTLETTSGKIDLTATELKLISLFLNSRTTSLSREDLIKGVWDGVATSDNVLDSLLTRLRQKMKKINLDIETESGVCRIFKRKFR